MLRSTKIVATLGPASSDPAVLERMVRAGVDVVRLNFSHGTATLALSISKALGQIDPRRVRRVRCRFSGMVLMPSTLTVLANQEKNEIHFETRKSDGELVVSRGSIELDG